MRQRSFGENKSSWLDDLIFYLRARKIIDLAKEGVVVEVGCGYRARLLKMIAKKKQCTRLVGVDLSVDGGMVGIESVTQDLNQKIKLDSDMADTVVSAAVLEHLVDPELNLREIYRILKPGGVFILTTPTKSAKPVLEFLAFKLGLIDQAEIADHKNYFDSATLRQMLARAGFKGEQTVISVFTFGFNNFVFCKK